MWIIYGSPSPFLFFFSLGGQGWDSNNNPPQVKCTWKFSIYDNTTWQQVSWINRLISAAAQLVQDYNWPRRQELRARKRGEAPGHSLVQCRCLIQLRCMGTLLLPFARLRRAADWSAVDHGQRGAANLGSTSRKRCNSHACGGKIGFTITFGNTTAVQAKDNIHPPRIA